MRVFKKKKTMTTETRRTVRSQGSARSGFVYYANRPLNRGEATANRAPLDRLRSQPGTPLLAAFDSKDWWRNKLWRRLSLALVLLLLGWLTVLGGTGKVVMIQTDGTQSSNGAEVYQRSIDEILATSLRNRSKVTINTQRVAAEISRRHPEIEHAIVTVPIIGSRPTVYIAKSEAVFTLQQAGSYYVLSASGFITDVVSGEPTLPLVQDETGETVMVGKRLVPSSNIEFMRTVLYQLEQSNLEITSFILPANKAYEVAVRLKDKPYTVRFNLEEDPLQQSGAAIATIEQMTTSVPVSYLDVRVPGRVYYK